MGLGKWSEIDAATVRLHALADEIESLVATVAHSLDAGDDDAPVAMSVAAAHSRELAAATARVRHAATNAQVVAAGLVELHGVHHCDAARTPRAWLARHAGLTHHQASALVRAATARERYPLIDRAFRAAEITAGHLDAIAGIIPTRFRGEQLDQMIDAVREIQPILLEHAAEMTMDEFLDLCARARSRLDADGPGDPAVSPSRVWISRTFNGRWALKGDLNEVDGPIIASILADAVAAMRPTGPTPVPDREASQYDGCDDVEARPSRSGLTGRLERLATPDPVPASELMAQALSRLLCDGAGARRTGRVSLFVHVDLADLAPEGSTLDDLMRHRPNAHTEANVDVEPESLWALLADADVTPVFNWDGSSLSYGRTQRLAPDILRRVLAHRDRRCRFPGCDVPAHRCQAHHVVEWDGPSQGETDPSNLALIDSKHHHDHHDRGWIIAGDANGALKVTRPDGTPFTAEPAYLEQRRDRRDPRDRRKGDRDAA